MQLEETIAAIIKDADELGYKLEKTSTLSSRSFVIACKDTNKAILIGEVKINKSQKKEIKVYKINIHKWVWVESEGFSKSQILDELAQEIFIAIEPENAVVYLI